MSLPAEPKERARVMARAMRFMYEAQDDPKGVSGAMIAARLGLSELDVEVLTFELETFRWLSSRGRQAGHYALTLQGMAIVALCDDAVERET